MIVQLCVSFEGILIRKRRKEGIKNTERKKGRKEEATKIIQFPHLSSIIQQRSS